MMMDPSKKRRRRVKREGEKTNLIVSSGKHSYYKYSSSLHSFPPFLLPFLNLRMQAPSLSFLFCVLCLFPASTLALSSSHKIVFILLFSLDLTGCLPLFLLLLLLLC